MSRLNQLLPGAALALLCCKGAAVTQESPKTKIGVIMPLSGEMAKVTEEIRTQLKAHVNSEAAEIELVWKDGKCNFESGRSAAQELEEEGAVAVLGGLCTAESLGALTVTEDAKIPMISPSASGIETDSSLRHTKFFYTLENSPQGIGFLLAEYVTGKDMACVNILSSDQDSYSSTLVGSFRANLEKKGIETHNVGLQGNLADNCATLIGTTEERASIPFLRELERRTPNQIVLFPHKESTEAVFPLNQLKLRVVSVDPPESSVETLKKKWKDALAVLIEALNRGGDLNVEIKKTTFKGESGNFYFSTEGQGIYKKAIFESN